MKRLIGLSAVTLLIAGAVVATTYQTGEASDHDDGENVDKERNLNLTDHFTFVSTDPATPNDLTMIMYFNPRSLPGKEYFLSTNAHYEFHVSKIAAATDNPTNKDDFVFRFEAAAPDATGTQALTLTVFKDGAEVGKTTGSTTSYAVSRAGNIANYNIKSDTVGNLGVKFFVGARADAFHFDVQRFFQVRSFLADRFFGKGTKGNAAASLADNCRGDKFLANVAGSLACDATKEAGNTPDADCINLFNPPSCAPDFTKNYNVLAIVLNVPIADLGGGQFFDTWSTVSVAK